VSRIGVVSGRVCVVVLLGGLVSTANGGPSVTVHGAGTASGGFTDNVLSASDDPAPGEAERASDVFTELSPALLVVLDGPRSLSELSYGVRVLLFNDNDAANSLNHQGDWTGVFLLSPRTQLTGNARVRAGQGNALAIDGDAGGSSFGVLPFGSDSFLSLEGGETIRRQLDRLWAIEQSAALEFRTAGGADTETRGIEAGTTVGVRRARRSLELGLDVGGRVIDLNREIPEAEDFDQTAGLFDLSASAARDLGRRWNVRASAGGRMLTPLDDSFATTFGPVGLLSASYVAERGEVTATVEHSLEPNLFVARNTTTDRALLRGRVPLPFWPDENDRPRFGITATAGVARVEALALEDNEVEAATDVFLADLGGVWNATRDVTVSLRYQYRKQNADPGLEVTVPSFDRSTVVVSVAGVYPRRSESRELEGSNRNDGRAPVLEERQ